MRDSEEREGKLTDNYQAGAIIGRRRPDEVAFPLRQDEFLILCDGTSGKERAGRDLYLGFFVGALIGLIGLIANMDWANLWAHKQWLPFTCFLVLITVAASSLTLCISRWRRMSQEDTPESRLKRKIHGFFRGSDSAVDKTAPVTEGPITHGSPIKLGEISFRYVPSASPLTNGWSLVGSSTALSCHFLASLKHEGGLTMQAEPKNAIDYKFENYQRTCNRLRFTAKLSGESHVYAKIQIASSDNSSPPQIGWIACDVGNGAPMSRPSNEWVVYRAPQEGGWTLFDLQLPDEVARTFGLDGRLKFGEMLGIRLRGSLSISPIELLRDGTDT